MNVAAEVVSSWGPFEADIQQILARLSRAAMPETADFLWFVLMTDELRGLPIMVWPAGRDQQPHDGWSHEYDLIDSVPETVVLPDLADTPENVARLRDACAAFLQQQWSKIQPPPHRLAYFSINEDGWYFSLADGRMISSRNMENEIVSRLKTV
ncbi:MAG: hypothetical protein HS117_09670 [Verrucomicrobiaceae bacterium]|nr:hypothetical protein [Verrucomicrobiaceae bacterium]